MSTLKQNILETPVQDGSYTSSSTTKLAKMYMSYIELYRKELENSKEWKMFVKEGLFRDCGPLIKCKGDVYSIKNTFNKIKFDTTKNIMMLSFENLKISVEKNFSGPITIKVNGFENKKMVDELKKITGYSKWDEVLAESVFLYLTTNEISYIDEYDWYDGEVSVEEDVIVGKYTHSNPNTVIENRAPDSSSSRVVGGYGYQQTPHEVLDSIGESSLEILFWEQSKN
jgi:hypothetical protein